MLSTPHLLAGTAIGLAVGNPVAGFVLAVASHFLLDAIPHTDPGTWHYGEDMKKFRLHGGDYATGIIDSIVAVGAFLALSHTSPLMAAAPIAGAIGGVLPDSLVYLGIMFRGIHEWPGIKQYNALIHPIHYTARPNQWVLGVVTQLAVIAISVGVILHY